MDLVYPPTGVLQCTHNTTAIELMPAASRHYARLKCASCGMFLRFFARPENVQRRRLNGFRLAKLQIAPGLNQWEREFVESLAKQGGNTKLTPKQQAVFDRLCLDYLKDGRDKLHTIDVLNALVAIEDDRPWASWWLDDLKHEKPEKPRFPAGQAAKALGHSTAAN